MPTYIFTDLADLKTAIGGAINSSIEMDSIAPAMLTAFQSHMEPWISTAQWDALVTAVAGTPSAEEAALLPYVKRALGMLTFYEYSFIGGVQFSEAGIHRTETDNRKSAYKYQEREYRQWMLNSGFDAIEQMLKFLDANEIDYPLWAASSAYTLNRSLFLNYSSEFRNAYKGKQLSRYTFEVLRPMLEELELFTVLPTVGKDQFDDLKTGILTKVLTAEETELITYIQRALAHFTVEAALKRNYVQIKEGRVVSVELVGDDGATREFKGSTAGMNLAIGHQDQFANMHLDFVVQFLTDNIDSFPLYKAYIEAKEEAAAAEEETCEDPQRCPLTSSSLLWGGSEIRNRKGFVGL